MDESNTAAVTTPALGQQYLDQIEVWETEINGMLGNPRSDRDGYSAFIHVALQVLAAQQQRLDLIALIDAKYSVRPELRGIATQRVAVGRPLSTTVRIVGGLFGSDLFIVDEKNNVGQSMTRLLVVNSANGVVQVLDVYSDPCMEVMTGRPDATHRLSWNACLPSRSERIVNTCQENGYVVLGWIPIEEINERRMPTY